MADLWSIISANYKTVGLTVPSKTPYVAVDPKIYEGTWTGKYADNKTFKFTISNVTGLSFSIFRSRWSSSSATPLCGGTAGATRGRSTERS